ncbi:hypothetical protein J6590_062268 [Homalodisca vitripennis]|nr:hypothetical protein J6590_062268 [Homalodisca vitripennis]
MSDLELSSDIREIIDEDLSGESDLGVQSDIEAEDFPQDCLTLEDFSSGSEKPLIGLEQDKVMSITGKKKGKLLPAAHQNRHQF